MRRLVGGATGCTTIVLGAIVLLSACRAEDQPPRGEAIPEAPRGAGEQTTSGVSPSYVYQGVECPATTPSPVRPSIHLADGALAMEDPCPLVHLYDLVSKGEPVLVEVNYPSRVTDVVRAGIERGSGPEVEFANFWEKHRSETEVGLVRLAVMLSGTPPANGGTIDAYRERLIATLTQGTVSRKVAERLGRIAALDGMRVFDFRSGSEIDRQTFLEALNRVAEGAEVDPSWASLALRHHLGEGRSNSAVSVGLSVLVLDNYLRLRSDRLFAAMYGNIRIQDAAAMGDAWRAFIDVVNDRDFEDSVREVDPDMTADAVWFECGGDALPGAPYNYGRFLFPPRRLSEAWANQMRSGPWPVGSASDGFTAEGWARFAAWQMLARESGDFADIMSLYREDMHSCGPP